MKLSRRNTLIALVALPLLLFGAAAKPKRRAVHRKAGGSVKWIAFRLREDLHATDAGQCVDRVDCVGTLAARSDCCFIGDKGARGFATADRHGKFHITGLQVATENCPLDPPLW